MNYSIVIGCRYVCKIPNNLDKVCKVGENLIEKFRLVSLNFLCYQLTTRLTENWTKLKF